MRKLKVYVFRNARGRRFVMAEYSKTSMMHHLIEGYNINANDNWMTNNVHETGNNLELTAIKSPYTLFEVRDGGLYPVKRTEARGS